MCVACDFSHGQGYRNLDMINEGLIDTLPVKIVLAPHGLLQVQTTDRSGIEGGNKKDTPTANPGNQLYKLTDE